MGVEISQLNETTTAQNSDVLPIVQNGETKKINTQNLMASKVNKSGDTLTGELNFNNVNDYGAIRKIRTINNTDYGVSIGVGGNTSARMELYQGSNNLGMVEVRIDGIYNGKTGNRLIETKSQIEYQGWQSVVLTRSDNNLLYIMLYGSNILKEGTYSIASDFQIVTYGSTNGTLTIPKSAISGINRKDWGFELLINRSGISGIASTQYNGIAVVSSTITLQSA